MKFRGYEHGIIPHRDLLRNLTIGEGEKEEPAVQTEESNIRRSTRLNKKKKLDYKTMSEGERPPPINENSEVAQHVM